MPNPAHLQILQQGVEVWNAWRKQNENVRLDLRGARLSFASLRGASLHNADLTRTNLSFADLGDAVLSDANLTGADVSVVYLVGTVFANTTLTAVRGLETCSHIGPSTLDHRTLAKSGPLPLAFLRGCGLPEALIEYLPSLLGDPIQYDSLFISYASRDQVFAERLYADCVFHGFLPPNPWAGCHSNHGKAATQST
jgi:hypothetical protein